jgi:hypothetical protein
LQHGSEIYPVKSQQQHTASPLDEAAPGRITTGNGDDAKHQSGEHLAPSNGDGVNTGGYRDDEESIEDMLPRMVPRPTSS